VKTLDAATLAALDESFLDASRIFMAISDTGEYLERRDLAISCCGLPVEELNWGFPKPPYERPAAIAEQVRRYFGERKLPFKLTFRQGESPVPGVELESGGWQRSPDPTPGMALAMPAEVPPTPEPLAIRRAVTPDEAVAFSEAAFLGFGYPVAAAHIFLNPRLLALPQVHLFSGSVDGEVVSTSMLVQTGRVAGIYFVATLPAQRGRGYGEALTWAAVDAGRGLGCEIATLQASKPGRPVYERMGFAHVFEHVHYLPPGSEESPGSGP